jgi:hypothetical protein
MAEINLKTLSPDTSLPTTGFLFGADSQASTNPSVYSTQTVATTLLGSTSLTGDVLTASAPVLNLTQTWNSVGTTFTGMKFNVVSDTSAAASLLMDLQVAGTSITKVNKTGTLATGAVHLGYTNAQTMLTCRFGTLYFGGAGEGDTTNSSWYMDANDPPTLQARPNSRFGFSSGGTNAAAAIDTILTRRAAANFRFGAADAASPVAQTLSVQSIVGGLSGTPNLSAAAYPFKITGAQGTGTGAGGSIVFQVAPAGGSGFAQNTLVDALTIAPVGTGSFLTVPQCATNIVAIGITSGNGISIRSGGVVDIISGGGGIATFSSSAAPSTQFNGGIGFSNGSTTAVGPDVFVLRDAANVLAIKNSTTAQEFRVYETTTGTIYKAILGNRQLMKISGASFTDGAGASAGTLTNAPAVGNPTKWIPIDDNGTTRYIPAW